MLSLTSSDGIITAGARNGIAMVARGRKLATVAGLALVQSLDYISGNAKAVIHLVHKDVLLSLAAYI